MEQKKYYIAYGSNMDEEQMAHRCPDARLIGRGILTGWQLLFKGSKTGSYATIERSDTHNTPILFWEISEQDERNLDRYEGFPTFYYKKTLNFYTPKDTILEGMAYIMHEDRPLGIPSEHYYGILEAAYKKFGFNLAVLEQAVKDSAFEQTRRGSRGRRKKER